MAKQKQKTTIVSRFSRSFVTSCIPQGWSLVAVGSLLKGTEYGVSEPGDAQGDTPIVGMKNIGDGKVLLSNLSTINSDGADLSKMILRKGDILLNRTNSPDLVGKVGIVREDSDAVFASYLVRLTVDPERMDAEYLNAWLNGDIAQRAIKRISTRAVSQANVNPTEFQKYCPVLFPEVEAEQTKIAAVLQIWDEAIDLHDALAEQLQKQHLALIYQLVFGSHRIAAFASNRKTNKYRWFSLPSDWRCERIGKLAREVSERNREDEGAEILSCSKYDGFVRSLEYFKKQVYSSDLTGYKRIHRGDFGFPSNHVEEGSIGLQNLADIGVVSPIYIVFRFSANKIDNEYAHYVLKTGLYRHIFEVSTSASVDRRGSLRWDEFATIPFPVPSLQEQREIVKVLHLSAKRLAALREERSLLERQKRGLMQKLLTGEWRVTA